MSWYNYVGSDPVNAVDPLGLRQKCITWEEVERSPENQSDEIVSSAHKIIEKTFCMDVDYSFYPPGGSGGDQAPAAPINPDCAKLRKAGKGSNHARGNLGQAVRNPVGAIAAERMRREARAQSEAKFGTAPGSGGGGDGSWGDAYRHFAWTFEMTKTYGPIFAADFARGNANSEGKNSNSTFDSRSESLGIGAALDARFAKASPQGVFDLIRAMGCFNE